MRFFRDLFTGPTNEHYDLGRVAMGLGVLGLLAAQGYSIFRGAPFDAMSFGTGFATVLGAGGFGIAMKDGARKHLDEVPNAGQ